MIVRDVKTGEWLVVNPPADIVASGVTEEAAIAASRLILGPYSVPEDEPDCECGAW